MGAPAWVLVLLAALVAAPAGAQSSAALGLTAGAANLIGRVVVVDARSQAACLKESIRGAHCLPAADFLGPHGRLASFRQIFWLLGTAGLSGKEHVLVVGDDPTERDFVAGMLYLCGQAKVSVLTIPVSRGAGLDPGQRGPGVARGMIRNPIYLATVREDRIVLRDELARELASTHPPTLLDGRTEAEYWGERIRALRGGHLPGAQSLPMDKARSLSTRSALQLPQRPFVAYGHDAFESIAYFALLKAGGGNGRVLLSGWAEWAAHPDLPVDAATYPELPPAAFTTPPSSRPQLWLTGLALFSLMALLALAAAAAYGAKRRK